MMRVVAIVLNYRTPELTAAALASLAGELDAGRDRAIVVDNGSADGSAERLGALIATRGWSDWAEVRPLPVNRGFAGGMNHVLGACDAEAYLLVNSDCRLQAGALAALRTAMRAEPDAGVLGPRLTGADGTAQVSCFRSWYASRARYFITEGGRRRLYLANACWTLGHVLARARAPLGRARPPTARGEWRAIWTGARPRREPPGQTEP